MKRLGSLILCSALLGCVSPPDACSHGERVVVCADVTPDPSVVDDHDRVVEAYQSYLGTEGRVRINLFARRSDVLAACGHRGGEAAFPVVGCADGMTVHQNVSHYAHEVVHAAAWPLGQPAAALQEGLAQAIGCEGRNSLPSEIEPDPALASWVLSDAAFFAGDWVDVRERYDVAASFVRYLIETYSLDALRSIYRDLGKGPSASTADAVFEAATGRGLEALVDAWVDAGPRPWGEVCEPIATCALPALEPGDVVVRPVEGQGSLVFVGERRNPGVYPGVVRLDEAASVVLEAQAEADPDAWVSLGLVACGSLSPASLPSLAAWDGRPGSVIARLDAGVYAMHVTTANNPERSPAESVRVRLRVDPDDGGCSPVAVDPTAGYLALSPERGASRRSEHYDYALTSASVRRADVRPSMVFGDEPPGLSHVEICESCGTGCERVREGELAPDEPLRAVLELSPTPTYVRIHADGTGAPTEAGVSFLD